MSVEYGRCKYEIRLVSREFGQFYESTVRFPDGSEETAAFRTEEQAIINAESLIDDWNSPPSYRY